MAGRGQNQGNGKNKHAFAPKPKIPPPPKREDPTKDSICHEYGETGDWKRNCPQYLAELLKKKKNAASRAGGSGIFAIELNTFLNRSLIYDTGCGTHICNTTQSLRASRKLKPRALSLYVGNGQREAVEAIGNFYLSLPSGLVNVLNNCHYAPSITIGIRSDLKRELGVSFYTAADTLTEADVLNSPKLISVHFDGGSVNWRVPSKAFSLLHLQKLSILLLMMLLRKPFGLGNSFLGLFSWKDLERCLGTFKEDKDQEMGRASYGLPPKIIQAILRSISDIIASGHLVYKLSRRDRL
ncbi:hypothetical protein Tco_0581021 [Tanacetum coccineum]